MRPILEPIQKWIPRRRTEVTIEIETADGVPDEPIYITGNHPALGNWQPDQIALHRQEDGRWQGKFILPRGFNLEFKITRGGWESEAVGPDGLAPGNYTHKISGNDVIRMRVEGWKDRIQRRKKASNPLAGDGEICYHRQVTAVGLEPRDIIIWLPPSYRRTKKRRYPVLYMHDGQNLFDPATSYTGVTWRVGETVSRMIREKQISEIIIVGIYNTERRLEEYSLSDLGARYRRFVAGQLKQFIDKEYRTRPERRHTAVMGSSMGGLVSFLLAWEYSSVFYHAGCMSPSFIYDRSRAIKFLAPSPPPAYPLRLYFDCGGIGGERRLLRGCRRVIRYLRRKGLVEGSGYVFRYFRDHNHSEHSWAARLHIPLRNMFGIVTERTSSP